MKTIKVSAQTLTVIETCQRMTELALREDLKVSLVTGIKFTEIVGTERLSVKVTFLVTYTGIDIIDTSPGNLRLFAEFVIWRFNDQEWCICGFYPVKLVNLGRLERNQPREFGVCRFGELRFVGKPIEVK